jgi:hypothetical protein
VLFDLGGKEFQRHPCQARGGIPPLTIVETPTDRDGNKCKKMETDRPFPDCSSWNFCSWRKAEIPTESLPSN